MSSSTSSFKTELKVLACVGLVLLSVELVFRFAGHRLSGDLKKVRDLPAQAERMSGGDGVTALMLGNSLIITGFDEQAFTEEIRSQGVDPFTLSVVAFHNSDTTEWYRLFRHSFVEADSIPDVVIVSTRLEHYWDEPAAHVDRIALYTPISSSLDIMREEHLTTEDRMTLLQSQLFTSFARRTGTRFQVLDSLIPYYEEQTEWVHDQIYRGPVGAEGRADRGFSRIERLLRLAAEHGVQAVLVIMPTRKPLEVPTELAELAKVNGAELLDCQDIPVTEQHFNDNYHMNSEGAKVFSPELARRLRAVLGQELL
jgi:hypothetical protein